MLQEQVNFREHSCFSVSFVENSNSRICLSSFTEKVNLDLKYRDFVDPCTYFFDIEGKVIGLSKTKYVASLLRRLSIRVEGIVMENGLKSTLFGSISLIRI